MNSDDVQDSYEIMSMLNEFIDEIKKGEKYDDTNMLCSLMRFTSETIGKSISRSDLPFEEKIDLLNFYKRECLNEISESFSHHEVQQSKTNPDSGFQNDTE